MKEGETYQPYVGAHEDLTEFTIKSAMVLTRQTATASR